MSKYAYRVQSTNLRDHLERNMFLLLLLYSNQFAFASTRQIALTICYPHLLSGDDVLVAFLDRLGLDTGHVTAGRWLSHTVSLQYELVGCTLKFNPWELFSYLRLFSTYTHERLLETGLEKSAQILHLLLVVAGQDNRHLLFG